MQTCREIKNKNEWDLEKTKLEIAAKNAKKILFILYDLRAIMFGTLGFGKDEKAKADEAWYNLPSMVEYGIKPSKSLVGISRGVKKKMEKKSGA